LSIQALKDPFSGASQGAGEQWRYSVADLLEHLPLAALEDKTVMEGLQPGGFPYSDPPLVVRVYPFGEVTVHLRQDGVRRFAGMQAAPLLWPRAVPDFLGQRISLGTLLEERDKVLPAFLYFLGVVVV
jgi:hypothetical protein